MMFPLLEACIVILAHNGKKYDILGLLVNSATKEADSTSERSVHKRETASDSGEKKLPCC